MNWNSMTTYGDAPSDAFESLCCHLFEISVKGLLEDGEDISFRRYRGAGGDGGVEAVLQVGGVDRAGLQAKWFLSSLGDSQWRQIKGSIDRAMAVHPNLTDYVVCLPRDLGGPKGDGKRCESDRWEGVVEECTDAYPDLKLHLWGDHEISLRIAQNEAVGVRAFWFSDSPFAPGVFARHIEMEKAAWMGGRFMSDLHHDGEITRLISRSIMDPVFRVEACERVRAIDSAIESVQERLEHYLALGDVMDISPLSLAKELYGSGLVAASDLDAACAAVESGLRPGSLESVLSYRSKAYALASALEEVRFGQPGEASSRKMRSFLRGMVLEQRWPIGIDGMIAPLNGNLLVLAPAGFGKTHAFCSEACRLSSSDYAFPILVRAAAVDAFEEWGSIVGSALGAGHSLDEDEVFQSLEACASRLDHFDSGKGLQVEGRVVVLVDGVDEAACRKRWLELIRRADVISSIYSRISFVFSSRPFSGIDKREELGSVEVRRLHSDGDVRVEDLMGDYFSAFGISLSPASPVRSFIRTPLELKLFCVLNEGKDLGLGADLPTNVVGLVAARLDGLEQEAADKYGASIDAQPVHKVLAVCAEHLSRSRYAVYDEIASEASLKFLVIDGLLEKVLGLLVECEALSRFTRQDGPLEPAETLYARGIQTFLDYMSAWRIVESVDDYRNDVFPVGLSGNLEALVFASVVIFNRTGYIATDNESFKELVLPVSDVLEFNCRVLSHVDLENAASASGRVLSWMAHGSTALISVVNGLICKVARVKEHPLGPLLLDRYLRSFKKAAARDAVWSLPSNLLELCRHEGIIDESNLRLSKEDGAAGMPLVVAWHTSSLDSERRELCENLLAGWAVCCPESFVDLFERMADSNDPQIRESLFAVAAVASFSRSFSDAALLRLANYILETVFGSLHSVLDASVRHHGRIIVEEAFARGLVSEAGVCAARPPYSSPDGALPLDSLGMEGDGQRGPDPMDYDRARYVVCDPISSAFSPRFGTGVGDGLVNDFLAAQAMRLDIPAMSFEQFCHCAVQGCIREWGWSKEAYSYRNKAQDGSIECGIDIAVRRLYPPATHGQRSGVVSIGEKYVWCARNSIMGYLADRLPFWSFGGREELDDYIKLASFRLPSPVSVSKLNSRPAKRYYLPPVFSLSKEELGRNCEGVKRWVCESGVFPFQSLIEGGLFDESAYGFEPVALDAFYHVQGWGAELCVWIASCTVKAECVSRFEELLVDNEGIAARFFQVENIGAYVDCDCYITPEEVCSCGWRDERNSLLEGFSEDGCRESLIDMEVYPGQMDCTESVAGVGDVYYTLPSKPLREMLGASFFGDGAGSDQEGKSVFEFRKSGEIGDGIVRQALCADAMRLSGAMQDAGLELVWFGRVLKRSDADYSDYGYDEHCENDRLFFVKKIGLEVEARLISQECYPSSG